MEFFGKREMASGQVEGEARGESEKNRFGGKSGRHGTTAMGKEDRDGQRVKNVSIFGDEHFDFCEDRSKRSSRGDYA